MRSAVPSVRRALLGVALLIVLPRPAGAGCTISQDASLVHRSVNQGSPPGRPVRQ